MKNMNKYKNCLLCPRKCGINRSTGQTGVCGVSSEIKVARAALHYWEEPCISGKRGSGAVFFSGCSLHCVFCQNREISDGKEGKVISKERLSDIFMELADKGAMIYGMIVNILSAVVIDKMIYGMNSGKVAFIVTKNGKRICDVIDECSQRGSTILKAQGGYKQDDIQVVMCACNSKEMYQVRKSVKDTDPDSLIVVVESHEVHGEGFKMTNIGEAEN